MEPAYLEKELGDLHIKMKKLVIVKPGCKELGNELVNRMSIYAYGLEIGAQIINRSAYGYPWPLKVAHALYARYIGKRNAECSLRAWRAPIFLPPTKLLPTAQTCDSLYFFGWVFRNPVGIEKYRKEIVAAFTPNKRMRENIRGVVSSLPADRTLIGIHLRQRPFLGFPRGDFLVPVERVEQVLNAYIREKNLDAKDVALVVVSDMPLTEKTFAGYTHRVLYGNTETNLFSLARCSAVIGTNTTFSNVAAWFGNVPHIVTTAEPVDWEYYKGKEAYFENKYATFAH